MTLIVVFLGANNVSSLCNLSLNPGNIVLPPDKTIFCHNSLRRSMSDFIIEL
jgi:hypothetical protein